MAGGAPVAARNHDGLPGVEKGMTVRATLAGPRAARLARVLLVVAAIPPLAMVAVIAWAWLAPLASPEGGLAVPGTVVLAADGTVLQRDAAAGLRIPVALDRIAPAMVEATVAAEDARFRSHPGIDPLAIARAAVSYRSNPSGASTITQQLARAAYIEPGSPRLVRKLRESALALQLERRRTKNEILALYLNSVYYGRGAFGVEAAARVYFGTSAQNLDIAQAAFLAGLPQLPSAYAPDTNMDAAKARQAYVLRRMRETGRLTSAESEAARREAIVLAPGLTGPLAPHFVQYAHDEITRLRPDLAQRDGLVIETTIDAALQSEVERSIDRQLAKLTDKNARNAAVIVLEPHSGALLAMAGSAGFDDTTIDGQVNVAIQPRQPGSALKPFLYAAAFERGYTPASSLLDVPSTFASASGPYSPMNYDRQFHGVVTLRTALASSFNVPAVRTLDAIGMDAFLEIAHRFGLRSLTDTEVYGPAVVLGGGEVRLLDLTAAYGALANSGSLVAPFAVVRVRDGSGATLYERPAPAPTRVLDETNAWLLADILSDSAARIPGFGEVTPLDLPFRAAAKTGTTTGFRDNWTLGFTADRVVGAWVGNTDGSAMDGVSGVDGAGPIWRDVMAATAERTSPRWLDRPAGLVRVTVCAPTGQLPGENCPSPQAEWFRAGTEPRATERYYLRMADGSLAIAPPLEAVGWARDAGLRVAAPGTGPAGVRIVQPAPGAVLYFAPELANQAVLLRAAAPDGERIELRVDGALVAREAGAAIAAQWPLAAGIHTVEAAVTANGITSRTTSTFEVRTR
ncbi:MAG: transglycosylase domain-containing protein [Dehalococcoidia bacterium]|nr:transglycosylase domain-containing protein [Dehalococcoidia bacterium]